ncbi:MAG: PaaI family thioesterase [Roseobacter sp.]
MTLKMTIAELNTYMDEVFEQVAGQFEIEALHEDNMRVRMKIKHDHLRPGGTVSGPSMFSLADVGAYFMTLARIGRLALAVTTNCSIDFMRKPAAGVDLVADVRLLKLGRQLSVCDVLIYSDGSNVPVARANLTYSIPPSDASKST